MGNFEIRDEKETHALYSPREGNEKEWVETDKTPNLAPKMVTRTEPEHGKLERCIDDRTPEFGNFSNANEDNCLENETSAFNLLLDLSGDADLHERDDSDSHCEFSQELPPTLAFKQKQGARPKFDDMMVIELPPDDSKTSL